MILQNFLKEEFHFTAYNTISYIKKGTKTPKKDDPILFHGARKLNLPFDNAWETTASSEETDTEIMETPKSRPQADKGHQSCSGSYGVKRTKSSTETKAYASTSGVKRRLKVASNTTPIVSSTKSLKKIRTKSQKSCDDVIFVAAEENIIEILDDDTE